MDDKPISSNQDPEELPAPSSGPPHFVPVKLKGVGGWLMFFVISQLALRPLMFFGKRGGEVTASQIAERFPFTATIIKIESAVLIGLLVAGILVACALLLRTGVSWPVQLTKLYLLANPLVALALAVLYVRSDLPEAGRNQLITYGVANVIGMSIICLVWFLYFTRSKRVQATYFGKII